MIVASSEGGLFEYGSDDDIARNLASLHAEGRGAKAVVGSVTSGDERSGSGILDSRISGISA